MRGKHLKGRVAGQSNSWKGGRTTSRGYVMVYQPLPKNTRSKHRGRYVAEHRLVMESHLGRKLERWEAVHHKNGNKADNCIENLELMTLSEHSRHHGLQRIPLATCKGCNKLFKPKRNRHQTYCSRECNTLHTRRPKNMCTCSHCGSPFIRRGSRKSNQGKICCSRQCLNAS